MACDSLLFSSRRYLSNSRKKGLGGIMARPSLFYCAGMIVFASIAGAWAYIRCGVNRFLQLF